VAAWLRSGDEIEVERHDGKTCEPVQAIGAPDLVWDFFGDRALERVEALCVAGIVATAPAGQSLRHNFFFGTVQYTVL